MEKKKIINIVGLNMTPETEEEYLKWYDETHVPMAMESGEMKRLQRFKRIGDDDNYPQYLTIVELEDKEAFERQSKSSAQARAAADAGQRWPNRSRDLLKWWVQYEHVKTWET